MLPDLMRVSAEGSSFKAIFESARAAGLKMGWLDMETNLEAPPSLRSPAFHGALRAVSVRGSEVVAVKTLVGEPVLRDVVREHFKGCRLVLVRGPVEGAHLEPVDGGWLVRWSDGRKASFDTDAFLAALRSPLFVKGTTEQAGAEDG